MSFATFSGDGAEWAERQMNSDFRKFDDGLKMTIAAARRHAMPCQ
ncbi:hypothetical protein ACUSIJ_03870 [Pseudochelatococcus sp. B33]